MILCIMIVGDSVGGGLLFGSDGFEISSLLGVSSCKNLVATHPSF